MTAANDEGHTLPTSILRSGSYHRGNDEPAKQNDIINIQPAIEHEKLPQLEHPSMVLHVAMNILDEASSKVSGKLESMDGLRELSIDKIISVVSDVLSSLEKDITQIDRLASPSTLGQLVFPEPIVTVEDTMTKNN